LGKFNPERNLHKTGHGPGDGYQPALVSADYGGLGIGGKAFLETEFR